MVDDISEGATVTVGRFIQYQATRKIASTKQLIATTDIAGSVQIPLFLIGEEVRFFYSKI
jgi:hypothetical protein